MSRNNYTLGKEMPYEKFVHYGPEYLTEAELLAIILRTGTKQKSALELAEDVLSLSRHPKEGLLGLYDLSLNELQKIPGIGEVKAIKLKCLTELCVRISRAKAKEGLVLTNSKQVADYFMERLRHNTTEVVVLVCMDSKGQILSEKKLSEGSVRMALISPREIFIDALKINAVNIILIHNHPSGDPSPSKSDRELTARIKEAGEWMDISLLDHIIIGDNNYYSFKESLWNEYK